MRNISYIYNFFNHVRGQIEILLRLSVSFSHQFVLLPKRVTLVNFFHFFFVHNYLLILTLFTLTQWGTLDSILKTLTIALSTSIIFAPTLTTSGVNQFVVFILYVFLSKCLRINQFLLFLNKFSNFCILSLIETFLTWTLISTILSTLETEAMKSQATGFRIAVAGFLFFFNRLLLDLFLLNGNLSPIYWIYINKNKHHYN